MTRRQRLATLALLLGASGTACSPGSPPGESPDGANEGAVDADVLVAQCEALATKFVSNCHSEYTGDLTPDTERVCMWTTYGQICRTGNTQLLFDSMSCFGDNKYCWTFSDPNTVAGCLANVHATGESAAARELLQNLCSACGGATCDGGAPSGQAELIPYVSDAELAAISTCRGNACTNSALIANCTSVPDVAGILACK